MSNQEDNDAFEDLLDYLKQTRAFDFTGYKRTSLMRRIDKRMQTTGLLTYTEYLDYLEVHPEEFAQLFNTILINVTSFFRDPGAWDHLATEALPPLLERKGRDVPIRVWTAGCASGEETYTVAIMLAELLGVDQFHDRVKIYATDVDEEALAHARHAAYSARQVLGLTSQRLETYFEFAEGRYVFRKDLRRSIIFGRHDLIQDAPISRVDLLTCRNVLMYFNSETQARILARFHFALNDNSLLLLGRAEMLFNHTNSFTPINLKCRVFSRVARTNLRDNLLLMGQNHREGEVTPLTNHMRLLEATFDALPLAEIVVDIHGALILINERARGLFGLKARDIGRRLQDVEISYRPVELRSPLEQAYSDRHTIHIKDISWPTAAAEPRWLDLQLVPLVDAAGTLLGASITFTDVSRYKRLQSELEHANQELETAYEELQSTNEELQSTNEELETTNEELQSTVEELETTNEELQSTNEEMETMNEELQSTNEELQTINAEIHRRSDELNHANLFLESILTSLRGGVIVVDRDLRVLTWSRRAEDLWGLRADEVLQKNLLILDIGLPVDQLRPLIRACLVAEPDVAVSMATEATDITTDITVEATNRRGKTIACRVIGTPLLGLKQEIIGVILVTEEQGGR